MKIIRDYMTTPVKSVPSNANLTEGSKIMAEHNIGSLLVKEDDEYLGIVTRTDIVDRVVAKDMDPRAVKAGDICSKPLWTIDFMLPLEEALGKMVEHKIKRVAVTQQGKVEGIISINTLQQELFDR